MPVMAENQNRVTGAKDGEILGLTDSFAARHIGPNDPEIRAMLEAIGLESLDELVDETVPKSIRLERALNLGDPRSEYELIAELKEVAAKNTSARSFLGMGYSDTIVPPVIQRNILENPGWYTQYTPYQAEISQGRLEALLNYQTMVGDLTGLPITNSSLLDEATAAAEAMTLCYGIKARSGGKRFFVSERVHPSTIAVLKTRATPLGIEIVLGDHQTFDIDEGVFGMIVQYPTTDGAVLDYRSFVEKAHDAGALVIVAADLLSLMVLTPPGEFGADVCVGSSQRFGVPLGYGGPHAAFLSTKEEYKRQIPGRIVGVSKDTKDRPGLRLALQTREQHIRREKATSNICTAQVLLAIMASMYAVYHGPEGLLRIAERVRGMASLMASGLSRLGYGLSNSVFFDTIHVKVDDAIRAVILGRARAAQMNLREFETVGICIALDEATLIEDVRTLLEIFRPDETVSIDSLWESLLSDPSSASAEPIPVPHAREGEVLTHPVFHRYHSETEFLRYVHRLQARDLSLTMSMIPLGSCTMKLNATSEMLPVTWSEFSRVHPFAPVDQVLGYTELFDRLEAALAEITGFDAISLQPNAGSQGEYAGLLVIREYHRHRGDLDRDVCLIPQSAHGTNPASASMAGMRVVVVKCDSLGNIDLDDLKAKASLHKDRLAALMVTYPSTHGVFEESIQDVCGIVHAAGGQVYLDGANLNAQVGLCRPGDYGADVCHLNLHKTFCIPHGGGGPGMGPIGVASHLKPFLPGHPCVEIGGPDAMGPVAGTPFGSASILSISYVYIALLGAEGLKRASEVAILNANYMASRLEDHYPVLYRGETGRVAHEFILDLRGLTKETGVTVEDVAKRMMDYGFHAPTISFPVPGTLMIEPTESEAKSELDRFCETLIAIRGEIQGIQDGTSDREDNVLKNAPHTSSDAVEEPWPHSYSREEALFPAPWTKDFKFWPPVNRINNVHGDRNLVCSCPPIEEYEV